MKCTSTSAVLVTLASLIAAEQVCADEIPPPYDQTAKKGLEWLALIRVHWCLLVVEL